STTCSKVNTAGNRSLRAMMASTVFAEVFDPSTGTSIFVSMPFLLQSHSPLRFYHSPIVVFGLRSATDAVNQAWQQQYQVGTVGQQQQQRHLDQQKRKHRTT